MIRRRALYLLLFGLAVLVLAMLAHNQGWIGRSAPTSAINFAEPEKPETEIFTGSGSAQFSIYAPQYPGSAIIEAARIEDAEGGTMMAVMTTKDDPVDVAEFYRSELARKGFRPRVRGKGDRTTISGVRRSAGLDVMVSITQGSDGLTRIELADNATIPDRSDREPILPGPL